MQVHRIHDLSSIEISKLLYAGLSEANNPNIIKNYHPDFSNVNSNLFFLLKNGRYAAKKGAYYIMEEDGKYVGSAGWNEYSIDSSIAFALTRMYVAKDKRNNYLVAKYILEQTLQETAKYEKVLLTVNEHNKSLYNWLVRAKDEKKAGLATNWPDIYRKFNPIGKHEIYGVQQYVLEYIR